MNVYVDIGNTNIKISYKDFTKVIDSNKKYNPKSFFHKLPKEIKKANIGNVFLVSVVPSLENTITKVFKKYLKKDIKKIQYPYNIGFKLKIDNPKKIGADLICLAAFVNYKTKNGIIINMGTATTITHIKNNALQGTVIVPGFKISYDALINNAAKLSDLKLNTNIYKPIGKNTIDSISIGLLKGQANMIKNLVKDIDEKADVYISGGNAIYLKEHLKKYKYFEQATIEGLKVISKGEQNENN